MDKATMAVLLMRPLTTYEDTNFDKYLKIARENLDQLLGSNLCNNEDLRIFDAREGYSTVWTDFFTSIEEVKVNGVVVTNYKSWQNDRRYGSWFNSIVFDSKFMCDTEVEISASWGFSTMPSGLQSLLAGLFNQLGRKVKQDSTVASKQIEDFRATFNVDSDLDEEFYNKYEYLISKYAMNNKGYLRHEKRHGRI
jgi:hypothetical protein